MTIPFEVVLILLSTAIGLGVKGVYQLSTIAYKVEDFKRWQEDHLKVTTDVIHRLDDASQRILRIETWVASDERSTLRDMEMIRELKQEIEHLRHAIASKTYAGD